MSNAKTVRIGCHSGFWGDTETAAVQLVRHGSVDYLVSDYLAEVTMSIMAAQKLRNPQAGYAVDFVTAVMGPLAREIAEKKIKVVTNAGGVNPQACRDAVLKACEAAGVKLKVAVVLGDDILPRADEFRAAGIREMDTGAELPSKIVSMNAYLGGFPIARALSEGADVVITGRCVDSAVTLGALIHAFGWTPEDLDPLAAGTLCGHIIECGAQCNGGNFTDWRLVPDYDNMGFPIAEVFGDGSFVLSKPEGTGGLITPATVAEQMLYEIGDPRAYIVPDVVCDFTEARYEQTGKDRVRVSGARGRPPTDSYKVSTTFPDGYKFSSIFMLGGREAAAKGRHSAESIVKKTRRMFKDKGMADFRDVSIEVIGAEATYGPHSRAQDSREVVVKIAAKHDQKEALSLLGREIAPMSTGGVVGMTGSFGAGRASASPVIRMFSCLVPKTLVPVTVDVDGHQIAMQEGARSGGFSTASLPVEAPPASPLPATATETVPLVALAYGRSGDKGDNANIGIFARKPEYQPILDAEVTEEAVANYFAHRIEGKVSRWRLPGINGFNFLLRQALGGGGMASLKADPLAKAFAQMLLDMPVRVPAEVVRGQRES
ncbi:acyclic terpene utilization AtuA family protein [Reyranella sp.]|uniref:acyclic terpene utilization AtuA family protein n=1 Tax=Reyranella sp. TaxID=1929291 RepID=UPI00272F5BC5|nr:acyclic terpene utilization AtuA family protein [Reyranella sp.]MDP2375476.1 acyclic terpene utilization AtuA family protein [Reyranella sp.]